MNIKRIVKKTSAYRFLKGLKARKTITEWNEQDQRMLEFYAQFVGKGDVCFDIGANIGNRTKIFLRLGARVIAAEPQPECANLLKSVFKDEPDFYLIEAAVGETEGVAKLHISSANTLSSLSTEWIQATTKSRRFSNEYWERHELVSVTTLDQLVSKYGIPRFIKIDVEGFELEVIKGLSQAPAVLSFEFTPEFPGAMENCILHLQKLGTLVVNYSLGEEMSLVLSEWVAPERAIAILSEYNGNHSVFGDVYIRFSTWEQRRPGGAGFGAIRKGGES